MRKIVILLSGVIVVIAFSPCDAAGPIKLGIKAGMSSAKQTWEYAHILGTVERDRRSGFAFGLFSEISLAPMLSLQPELLYVQKGNQVEVVNYTYAGPAGTRTVKDRIDYLSVAIMAKGRLIDSPVAPYLFAGPRMDIKLSAKSEFNSEDVELLFDAYEFTVPGLTFGAGLERSIGSAAVLIEFQYLLDLDDACKHVNPENEVTIRNKAFSIMAGIKF